MNHTEVCNTLMALTEQSTVL